MDRLAARFRRDMRIAPRHNVKEDFARFVSGNPTLPNKRAESINLSEGRDLLCHRRRVPKR